MSTKSGCVLCVCWVLLWLEHPSRHSVLRLLHSLSELLPAHSTICLDSTGMSLSEYSIEGCCFVWQASNGCLLTLVCCSVTVAWVWFCISSVCSSVSGTVTLLGPTACWLEHLSRICLKQLHSS